MSRADEQGPTTIRTTSSFGKIMKRSLTFGLAIYLYLAVSAKANLGAYLKADSFVSTSPVSEADTAADFSTPVVWSTLNGGNGHLYELTPARSTWTAEEAVAEAMGGHLVSINSQAEQDFVDATFLVGSMATVPLWIGLTDLPPAGSANYSTWTTGEPVTYTNFNPGEPNDQNGDEHYVALNWHYSFGSGNVMGTWDDLANGGSTVSYNPTNDRALGPYYGIVEVVPEPGTPWILALAGLSTVCWKVRRLTQAH